MLWKQVVCQFLGGLLRDGNIKGETQGGQGQVRGVLVELDLTELPELVPGFLLPYCLGWLLSEGEGSGGTQALGKVRGGPMIQIHGQDQRFDLALFGQDLRGRGLPGGDDADLLRLVQVGKAAGGGIAALTTAEEKKKHQGKESKQTHRNLAFQK